MLAASHQNFYGLQVRRAQYESSVARRIDELVSGVQFSDDDVRRLVADLLQFDAYDPDENLVRDRAVKAGQQPSSSRILRLLADTGKIGGLIAAMVASSAAAASGNVPLSAAIMGAVGVLAKTGGTISAKVKQLMMTPGIRAGMRDQIKSEAMSHVMSGKPPETAAHRAALQELQQQAGPSAPGFVGLTPEESAARERAEAARKLGIPEEYAGNAAADVTAAAGSRKMLLDAAGKARQSQDEYAAQALPHALAPGMTSVASGKPLEPWTKAHETQLAHLHMLQTQGHQFTPQQAADYKRLMRHAMDVSDSQGVGGLDVDGRNVASQTLAKGVSEALGMPPIPKQLRGGTGSAKPVKKPAKSKTLTQAQAADVDRLAKLHAHGEVELSADERRRLSALHALDPDHTSAMIDWHAANKPDIRQMSEEADVYGRLARRASQQFEMGDAEYMAGLVHHLMELRNGGKGKGKKGGKRKAQANPRPEPDEADQDLYDIDNASGFVNNIPRNTDSAPKVSAAQVRQMQARTPAQTPSKPIPPRPIRTYTPPRPPVYFPPTRRQFSDDEFAEAYAADLALRHPEYYGEPGHNCHYTPAIPQSTLGHRNG